MTYFPKEHLLFARYTPQNDILCYSISHMFYFLPYEVFKLVFETPLKFLKLHQHLDVEPDLQREITDTQLDVLN